MKPDSKEFLELFERKLEVKPMPLPGGQKAFWIEPSGKVVDIGDTNHINFLTVNNTAFKISDKEIEDIHRKYHEPIGVEGKARDEIIINSLKKGFITLRYMGRESKWVARVYDLKNRRVQDKLFVWAQAIVKKNRAAGDDPVAVIDFRSNQTKQTTVADIAADALFEGTRTVAEEDILLDMLKENFSAEYVEMLIEGF